MITRLATSQPAISRAIGDLEHALGVRLLDRTPSGVKPTPYGHALMKRGLAAFDELRQGVKDIEFLTDPTSGELRIGCSEYAAGGPVLAVINRLTKKYPRMVFEVVTGPVLTLYRDLSERRVELVITRTVEFADRSDMVVENLFDDDIVTVAAMRSPWSRRRRIELAELVNEPWTLPSSDTGIGAFAITAFRARGLEPPRTTVRLIRECGLVPGMRVLDIGCGVGDMSMLLAEAVGNTGRVVAFDREPVAIEIARARAFAAGYGQIEFVIAAGDAFPDRPLFDAAIGRYVLHHQSDPVAMIRRAAAAVRRGGTVAFHEPAGHIGSHTLPVVDLHQKLERCLNSVFDATLPRRDVGGRLIACFEEAGLPTPHLIWESIAGGYNSPLWQLLAMTYRSILPHIAASRGSPDMGDPGTLADRLVAQAAAARAQIVSKPQSCAWANRP